jgi:hypothetical protein
MKQLELSYNPSQVELKKIEEWLFGESKNSDSGFYYNIDIIKEAFTKDRLIILKKSKETVGFLVWRKDEIYITVDIMEIHPNYRNLGHGIFFIEQISTYFSNQGFVALKLFCAPEQSEKFWKKLKFIKFPNRGYSESELTYFKPLVQIKMPSTERDSDNRIELWNLEPHETRNQKPNWVWNFDNNTFDLSIPILQPCNSNWNICWIKDGLVQKEGKVKYFSKITQIDFDPFLFMKELKE